MCAKFYEPGQTNREFSVLSQDNDTSDSNHHLDEFPDLYEPSQLRLVESALCSGLPNEIEVALNALLVLVRIAHCPNLLSLLLASVGIYGEDVQNPYFAQFVHVQIISNVCVCMSVKLLVGFVSLKNYASSQLSLSGLSSALKVNSKKILSRTHQLNARLYKHCYLYNCCFKVKYTYEHMNIM
ncbi:unnamed protein product [Trichobilharzia regenti]|nr:unnamed protein product [Trichobilharzia regenti]